MFETRLMTRADVPACVKLINHIIALGGSTAHEDPFGEEDFAAEYLEEPQICYVVLCKGRVIGFQATFDIGDGLYAVGSFTDRRMPVRGAGRA